MSRPEPKSGWIAERRYRHVVAAVSDIPPGTHRIIEVQGRSIGVFNVGGRFYALRNRCPHKGGPLCAGLVCGTTLPSQDATFEYGRAGEILRCAWHGWEFEIATGQALADPRMHARTYPVSIQDGQVAVLL